MHLESEKAAYICNGAHWRFALAFAMRGEHEHEFSRSTRREAQQRLDELISETFGSMYQSGRIEIRSDLAGLGLDVSLQAHTMEWLVTAVSDETFADNYTLHRGIDWLIGVIDEDYDELAYRDLAHSMHAFRLYLDRADAL